MAVFLISYDLIKGKDYDKILTEIKKYPYCQVLLSQYAVAVDSSATAASIRNHFTKFLDNDDYLVVNQLIKGKWTMRNSETRNKCLTDLMDKHG